MFPATDSVKGMLKGVAAFHEHYARFSEPATLVVDGQIREVTGESFIEDMRTAGNDAVGLGIPFWLPGGGENHPDAIVTEQSIRVDGQKIVEDGAIIGPPHLAKPAEKLAS